MEEEIKYLLFFDSSFGNRTLNVSEILKETDKSFTIKDGEFGSTCRNSINKANYKYKIINRNTAIKVAHFTRIYRKTLKEVTATLKSNYHGNIDNLFELAKED